MVDVVQELVYARSLNVLALPSDTVGQRGSDEPMGSLTLTLLRNIKNVNLLVVKANSAGMAHRTAALQAGARRPSRTAIISTVLASTEGHVNVSCAI